MTNIYNRSVFDRNSIQSVPSGYIDNAANDLFLFLGSFWKNIHQGREFIKGLQHVRGIKLAQFYLDLIESLKLQDRNGLPVFHRELWKPLIIRKSQRNTAQENSLKIGDNIVLGQQPDTSVYGNVTLHLGKLANFENYVTYPVNTDIVTIVSGVTNNVINPTVVWEIGPGKDIVYTNGTLIIPKDKDPFLPGSGFDPYDLPEFFENPETHEKESDCELVLWASDVLIDKNYVADHMAYALGVNCQSSDITKRIINAGWDAINCGLTPEFLRSLLASMVNAPVVQEDEEEIIRVVDTTIEKKVITDKHTYTIWPKAKLRKCVAAGEKVHRGDLLDESVKIYPILTDLSDEKISGTSEYADIFKTDVPVISIPKTMLSTKTANGICVDWDPKEVLTAGTDSNGHEKLYFELGGSEEDVDAFWEDIWERAEKDNIDLAEYFEPYEPTEQDSTGSSSDDVWMVSPASFFLRHLIGANTLIVTIDRSQIEDISIIRNPVFFNMLNNVIPSGMRMFFIEHIEIDEDGDDEYDLGNDVDDEADKYVYEDADEDEFDYMDLPGMKGKNIPSYDDQVEMKFYRNRKRNAD